MPVSAHGQDAELDAAIEAFITHPVPYALGDARPVLREQTRAIAFAHLLGELAELIKRDAVTTESVAAAVFAAIAAGTDYQDAKTAQLLGAAA
jgi:hypothetical protein